MSEALPEMPAFLRRTGTEVPPAEDDDRFVSLEGDRPQIDPDAEPSQDQSMAPVQPDAKNEPSPQPASPSIEDMLAAIRALQAKKEAVRQSIQPELEAISETISKLKRAVQRKVGGL